MTQKGPELKSSILGRFTSALRVTRGNRPRGVHFWPYIFSRITFSVCIGCIWNVFWVYFDLFLCLFRPNIYPDLYILKTITVFFLLFLGILACWFWSFSYSILHVFHIPYHIYTIKAGAAKPRLESWILHCFEFVA